MAPSTNSVGQTGSQAIPPAGRASLRRVGGARKRRVGREPIEATDARRITALEDARAAGLHYRFDDAPGIRRERRGKRFAYIDASGRRITDAAEIARLERLAVPPAWERVWISPDPRAHLLATGRDQRGRKQYRYHPEWRAARDSDKFDRLIAFAETLPKIRRAVTRDLGRRGLPREKVLAAIVRLLEQSLIRVGNDEYARANRSFGLTTLRDRHVEISGFTVRFEFQGKGGKHHQIKVADRRLARIVKNCRDLPGYELFQYLDDAGERHRITSDDVNDYLHAIAGDTFSAKDFRTWHGTVLAVLALQELHAADDGRPTKRTVTQAVERVAARLGNTPAICRKCYIHPAVIAAFAEGRLIETLTIGGRRAASGRSSPRGLGSDEAMVLRFLRRRLADGGHPTKSSELTAVLRRAVAQAGA